MNPSSNVSKTGLPRLLSACLAFAVLQGCGAEFDEAEDAQVTESAIVFSGNTDEKLMGGAIGQLGIIECTGGYIAVGIHGTYLTSISSLGLICAVPNSEGMWTRGQEQKIFTVGSTESRTLTRRCPTSQWMYGYFARHNPGSTWNPESASIIQISIICRNYVLPEFETQIILDGPPGPAERQDTRKCKLNQAIRRLNVYEKGTVRGVSGGCADVEPFI